MMKLISANKTAILLFSVVFCFSCNTSENKDTLKNNYFDSDTFFQQQIDLLGKAHAKLFITATANNNTEQRENKSPDWGRELVEFKNSNIHKNSFTGRYSVDTSVVKTISDTSILISYVAKEQGLKTRRLDVYLSPANKSIKRIHIVNYSKNFLSNLSEDLDYNINKGYSIYSSEGTRFMGIDIYEVKADIEFGDGYFQ